MSFPIAGFLSATEIRLPLGPRKNVLEGKLDKESRRILLLNGVIRGKTPVFSRLLDFLTDWAFHVRVGP